MYRTLTASLLFLALSLGALAQSADFSRHIEAGVKQFEAGNYEAAIEEYEEALKHEGPKGLAQYEIAYALFSMKEYKKSIKYCDKVLDAKGDYLDKAYMIKGSCLDLLGEVDDAIATYQTAINDFPESYLLHYNLALAAYNAGKPEMTKKGCMDALMIYPEHSSSHMLLGYQAKAEGKRVKALLAFYNFLLVEPNSQRSAGAYDTLLGLLRQGVEHDGKNKTNISLSLPAEGESDEFAAAELMLGLLEASKTTKENKKKTEFELFCESTDSFFTVLGELRKPEHDSFWWTFYVDFFYDMHKAEQVNTFCAFIMLIEENEDALTFLEDAQKRESFIAWLSERSR